MAGGLTCKDVVELVTEYLEGSLGTADRARFAWHLRWCKGCARYLEQMRETIALTGAVTEESLPLEARDALVRAFRDWRRAV